MNLSVFRICRLLVREEAEMKTEPEQGFVVDINAIGAPITIIKVTPNGRFYWEAFNELSAQHMDPN